MSRQQQRKTRRRMVRSYLAAIDNDRERSVCFFLMRGLDDADIRTQLGIGPVRLEAIKLRIAFGLKAAGIQVGEMASKA